MSLIRTNERFLAGIRDEIASVRKLGTGELWESATTLACSGGQLRPRFIYGMYCACHPTSEIPDGLIRDTAALELLHTSTLIHDDIIDGSECRRGLPSLHSTYGTEVALLVANLFKDHAIRIASPIAAVALNRASLEVNLGQLWETQARYQAVINLNDVVLIGLFKAGRIFRRAVDVVAAYASIIAKEKVSVGIELVALLYQAADDWLDLANVPGTTNKQGRMDESNAVQSFMYACWAFEPSDSLNLGPLCQLEAHEHAIDLIRGIQAPLNSTERLADLSLQASRRILLSYASAVRARVRLLLESDQRVPSVLWSLLDRVENILHGVVVDPSPHFDELSENFDVMRPPDNALLETLGDVLALRKGAKVLDVGCGTGADLFLLRENFGIVPLGIDLSPKMAERAALRLGDKHAMCGDGMDILKMHGSDFDAALLKFVVHHFSDVEELFAKILVALKSGGRVAVVTMLPNQVRAFRLVRYFPTLCVGMLAVASKQDAIFKILSSCGFGYVGVRTTKIANIAWDRTLIEKVRSRFISFLEAVPDSELEEGLGRLERDIESDRKFNSIVVEGCVVFGRKPNGNLLDIGAKL